LATEFVRGLAFIAESDADKVESKQCPNGGTGRRARFRTWFSQGSGGSSPLSGTIRIMAKAKVRQKSSCISYLLRVQFVSPILYLVSRTAFATLRNSVIFLVAVCCALTLGNQAMVWGPLKQNYGGMRIRARHVVQEFSAQALQTHRAFCVSDLRHIVIGLRSC